MIELLNCDCMEYMATQPNNAFDLAIVDPPYGQGDVSRFMPRKKGCKGNKIHKDTTWNKESPGKEYFNELFRVTENQVIWGANHYPKHLPISRGWIFWDKIYENTYNFSDGELAFTSFDRVLKMVRISARWIPGRTLHIHPTQKPIKLYEWLLTNYAKPEQRILDTHLGSGSSAIAAHYFRCDFVGCEIDKDYYNAACERFDMATAQKAMEL